MFLVIGKYIFENNLESDYINELIANTVSIATKGKDILNEAIQHTIK